MDAKFKGHSSELMGMAAQGGQSQDEKRVLFDCGVLCLTGGRVGEAYGCLNQIQEPNSAALFNMAICCLMAKQPEESFTYLQKAVMLLPRDNFPKSENKMEKVLNEYDAQTNGYLQPMSFDMPELFPTMARRQILRTLCDVSYKIGQYDQVKKIAAQLDGHYNNVDELLSNINNKS